MKQSENPARTDYLVRLAVEADLADGAVVMQAVKQAAEQLRAFLLLKE